MLDSIVHDEIVFEENESPKKKRGKEEAESMSSHSFSSAEGFKDDVLPTISNAKKGLTRNPLLADQQSSSESLERMFKVLESSHRY